jgi:hypothetical protein
MRTRIRKALLTLSALALAWAIVVAASDGFSVRLGQLRLSSHSAMPALMISIGAAAAALLLTTRDERRKARSFSWLQPDRLDAMIQASSPYVGGVAAVTVIVLGLTHGVFEAGGADSYGYVSQAELWTHGLPVMKSALAKDPRWQHSIQMLAPLGYVRGPNETIVPQYAPGLPLTMALLQRIGGRDAVYWAVPLLGGVAVLATYLLGAQLAGSLVGAAGALLVATSPPFLFQLLLPMSDVPVSAWWTLAWALAMRRSRVSAFLGGLAASMAILTRPNLVPLVGVLVAFLWWQDRKTAAPRAPWRVAGFVLGLVPGCLAIALINQRLYGSPVASGYGPLAVYYSWTKLIPNLRRYPGWLFETQTPVVMLAVVAPFLVSRVVDADQRAHARGTTIAWLIFIAAVLTSYLFYTVYNDWWYLRFVLPAFPPLLVLTVVSIAALCSRFAPRAHALLACALTLGLAWHGVAYANSRGTFEMKEGEHRATAVGGYIAQHFPPQAVFIAFQQSGSVNYYAGRQSLMFEAIGPGELQSVLDDLRTLGYHPYYLLERWEEPIFKNQFAGQCRCAALDWPPRAEYVHGIRVRIYDPADRDDPAARQREPDNIYAR